MKWVITSDWHLDAVTAGFERFNDIDAAVREVVATAIAASGAARFVFMGDLCDPHTMRSHRATAYAIAINRTLAEHHVESWWLTGNHDVIEDGTGTSTLTPLRASGATVFDEPTYYDGVVVFPYTSRSRTYDPELYVQRWAKEPVKLVLAHLNIPGIGPGSETKDMPRGRDVSLPLDSIKATWPKAFIFNGHYHQAQTFKGVHIPGSLARLTFGEAEITPGFLVWEDKRRGVVPVSVESRPLFSVQADAPLWNMNPDSPDLDVVAEMQRAPLVRLFPPAAAPDAVVLSWVLKLSELGAAAVRLMPVEKAAQPVPARVMDKAPKQGATHREVVLEMVNEARVDKRSLLDVVAEHMDAEGL